MLKDILFIVFLVLLGPFVTKNIHAESGTAEGSYAENLHKLAVAFDPATKTLPAENYRYAVSSQEQLRLVPDSALADISIQFMSVDGPVSSMYPRFKVTNIGDTTLNLGGLALRYWFNCDCVAATTGFEGVVDWAGFMPSGLSITSRLQLSFEPASSGRQTHVMVVRFVSDSPALPAGQSVEIHTRFNRKDWGNMPPINDWSYAPFNTFTGWRRVAGYIDGNRVWGQEP